MFGSKKRLYEHGEQTTGQVYARTSYGNSGGMQDYGIKVRVAMPDGSVAEFEKGPMGARGVYGLQVGSVVPVRFDPQDLSKVVLDMPALEAQQGQRDAVQQTALDAQFAKLGGAAQSSGMPAEAGGLREQLLQLAAQNPAAVRGIGADQATQDPIDRLVKLAELRDRGVLSVAEFATQKEKLLNGS